MKSSQFQSLLNQECKTKEDLVRKYDKLQKTKSPEKVAQQLKEDMASLKVNLGNFKPEQTKILGNIMLYERASSTATIVEKYQNLKPYKDIIGSKDLINAMQSDVRKVKHITHKQVTEEPHWTNGGQAETYSKAVSSAVYNLSKHTIANMIDPPKEKSALHKIKSFAHKITANKATRELKALWKDKIAAQKSSKTQRISRD